jgi:hypothetical protein
VIPRKIKTCNCGCGKSGIIWARGKLKDCDRRVNPPKALRKISEKKAGKIKDSKDYYREAIGMNILKNKGKCLCDNCGDPIKDPLGKKHGRAVCHIIGSGANETLYLDPENHFVLGRGPLFNECNCGWMFDESGEWETMKIGPEAAERKERLNRKYYDTVAHG